MSASIMMGIANSPVCFPEQGSKQDLGHGAPRLGGSPLVPVELVCGREQNENKCTMVNATRTVLS